MIGRTYNNEDVKEGETAPISLYRNFLGTLTSGSLSLMNVGGNYYPLYNNKEQFEYNSIVAYINKDITSLINKYKEQGITRLYYRGNLGYKLYTGVPAGTVTVNGNQATVSFDFEKGLEDLDFYRLYMESVVKYIDIK